MTGDLAIVRNMHIRHDPVVIAHASHADILGRTGIDRDVLTHHVSVTDLEPGGLSLVLFVLRHATNRTKTIEDIVFAYGRLPVNDAMRSNLCSRPDAHTGSDDA